MANHTAINVGVLIHGNVIDLRIPCGLNHQQLCNVLAEALANIGISVPAGFSLEIKSKQFGTDGILRFDEYAIHDGDQIWVRWV